jgi:hypothetical protein
VRRAAAAPKKPGPEEKKLEMCTGKWSLEETVFETPLGPAGKRTGTEEDRMICGGFFLEIRGHTTGPEGKVSRLEILAYDSAKSHYQDSFFSSTGEFDKAWKNENAICTISGNTWNWSWSEEKGKKKYQMRQVVVFAADRMSFTWSTSYSEDGSVWKKRNEAKATKVGDVVNE